MLIAYRRFLTQFAFRDFLNVRIKINVLILAKILLYVCFYDIGHLMQLTIDGPLSGIVKFRKSFL